jgi:hypothetical protein
MARSLKIRCSAVALILGILLAGCGGSTGATTPQPAGEIPAAAQTPVASTAVAATAVATPAASDASGLSDGDIAATIVAAPSSP